MAQRQPSLGKGSRPVEASSVYAEPRVVTDLSACYFYHTMEVPGYGLVTGEWDLRQDVDAYIGGVDLRGKRVLELGTASGFLCFEMERRGAEVVGYDLSENHSWDIVPMAGVDYLKSIAGRKAHIRRINDGWWLAHRANGSHARVVYGNIYEVPEEIGPLDVATFGSILLHVRDPFAALERSLRLVRESVIVTEVMPWPQLSPGAMHFLPNQAAPFVDTWWRFTPAVIQQMLGVLGFEQTVVSQHGAPIQGNWQPLFTVVGRRTKPPGLAAP